MSKLGLLSAVLILFSVHHPVSAQAFSAASLEIAHMMDESTPEQLAHALNIGEFLPVNFDQITPDFKSGPRLHIYVSIATESLQVEDSTGAVVFGPIKVSTADTSGRIYGKPYHTATGTFGASCGQNGILPMQHAISYTYNNSPMPDALFYYRGYAIHGTFEQSMLGRPASHGCVRVSLDNAGKLWNLVMNNGGAQALCITVK